MVTAGSGVAAEALFVIEPDQDPETNPAALSATAVESVVDWAQLELLSEDEADERNRQRQQAMLARLGAAVEATAEQLEDDDPRKRSQQSAFGKMYQHFTGSPAGEEATLSALMLMATNWGKTVFGARTIEALGIGERLTPGDRPLSALWLTEYLPLAAQTQARFGEFIPQIPSGRFDGYHKDLSQPITIMPYRSFQELSPDDRRRLRARTDAVVLDEADCGLGIDRAPKIKEFIEGKVTVALTATDNFPDSEEEEGACRRISTAWGIETVDSMSPREALDGGVINGCQIFLIASGKRVAIKSKRKSFTERDLRELRDDPDRDDLIMSGVQWMAEEGIPGWVKCIRGGDDRYDRSAQARRLAARANETIITDPATKQPRPLRAEAVGSFLTNKENLAILRRYNDGELDTIFYSALLTRGIDSDRVGYVFATEPTSSLTEMIQTAGRGARYKPELTIYLQIVDTLTDNSGKPYTFLHVFEEEEEEAIEQGKARGQPGGGRGGGGGGSGRRRLSTQSAPDLLRDAMDALSGVILADVTLVSRQPPPEGWLRSAPLRREFGFVAVHSLANAMRDYPGEELGDTEPPYVVHGPGGKNVRYYFNPRAVEWARDGGVTELASADYAYFSDMRRELGISNDLLMSACGLLGYDIHWLRLGDRLNRMGRCLTQGDYAGLKAYIQERHKRLYDPKVEISTGDMADALGHNRSRVRIGVIVLNKRRPPDQQYAFHPRRKEGSGRDVFCLPPAQAKEVMDAIGRRMPADVVLIDDLPARLKNAPDDINGLLARSPFRWQVVTKQVFNLNNSPAWLTAEDANAFTLWANNGREQKSTLGRLEELAGLEPEEAARLDSALFDITRPQGLPPELAEKIAPIVLEAARASADIDDVSREALEDIFGNRKNVLEVIAKLIVQQRIYPPEKPHVTNVPRYFAAQLDRFLSVALNNIGTMTVS